MSILHSIAQIFQQQVQFPFAVHGHTALDAHGIVLRQKIGVDAGDGDKHIRLAIGAAAVNGHAPAFVAVTGIYTNLLPERCV